MSHLLSKFKLPICFGGGSISGEGRGYGFGDISAKDSIKLLKDSYDKGVEIFDTAPIYGFSTSEKRIGEAFCHMREKVFIVSKSGITWDLNKRVDLNNDPKVTEKMLEQTLRDLNSEYIDLYMIHWPDEKVDIRRPLEVLSRAKRLGKIKHIGLCNTNLDDLERASEIDTIEVVQSELNLFNRNSFFELKDYLDENTISFMGWGTFDKGIITGRVSKNRVFDKNDARSWAPWWKKSDKDKKIDKMEQVLDFLKDRGVTGAELAIAHNLSLSPIISVICGMRSISQLNSTIETLENLPDINIINQVIDMI